jgi:uncharacterized protein (TIGR04255 family)
MGITIPKAPYPKDPINEAVIQIATDMQASQDSLTKLARHFEADYPYKEPLTAFGVTIDTTGGAAQMKQELSGYRLISINSPDVLVVQPGGIVTARLAPYAGWEQLLEATKRAWSQWRYVGNSSSISRLGVRYINRLDITIESVANLDLSVYLNFFPKVPNFSSKSLTGYVVQATVPTEQDNWSVSLTSTILNPPPLINTVSILSWTLTSFGQSRFLEEMKTCGNVSSRLDR